MDFNAQVINNFKHSVKENAERVRDKLKRGINEYTILNSDFLMIDYYVNYFGADRKK